MGWMGSLIEVGGSLLGGWLGSEANKDAAQTASDAGVAGAQITADANREATKMILDAQERARQEMRAAADRGIGYIDTGAGAGKAAIGTGYDAGIGTLSGVVADYTRTLSPMLTPPGHLTAAQRIQQEDLLRDANATVAASGLRGAGRAGVSTVLDANRRFMADADERNRARSDGALKAIADTGANTAARTAGMQVDKGRGIAGIETDTGRAKANTEIGVGNNIGNSITQAATQAGNLTSASGQAQGGAVAQGGLLQGQAGVANGNLWGGTIGTIGSVIADEVKQRQIGAI